MQNKGIIQNICMGFVFPGHFVNKLNLKRKFVWCSHYKLPIAVFIEICMHLSNFVPIV